MIHICNCSYFQPKSASNRDESVSRGSPWWPYLDNQEDVRRGVCDGEDCRASEGGDGSVGVVGTQHVLHLVRVQVEMKVLRNLGLNEPD